MLSNSSQRISDIRTSISSSPTHSPSHQLTCATGHFFVLVHVKPKQIASPHPTLRSVRLSMPLFIGLHLETESRKTFPRLHLEIASDPLSPPHSSPLSPTSKSRLICSLTMPPLTSFVDSDACILTDSDDSLPRSVTSQQVFYRLRARDTKALWRMRHESVDSVEGKCALSSSCICITPVKLEGCTVHHMLVVRLFIPYNHLPLPKWASIFHFRCWKSPCARTSTKQNDAAVNNSYRI